jgi:phage tail-like protein
MFSGGLPSIPFMPTEVHPSYRFAVEVDNVVLAAFSQCSLPSLQLETQAVKEGGQNTYVHTLPVRVTAGNVRLKTGVTRDAALFKWYLEVMNGDIANAMRQVSIVTYDVASIRLATWTLYRAYPVKWTGPSLDATSTAAAVQEVELAYHGFEMETSSLMEILVSAATGLL